MQWLSICKVQYFFAYQFLWRKTHLNWFSMSWCCFRYIKTFLDKIYKWDKTDFDSFFPSTIISMKNQFFDGFLDCFLCCYYYNHHNLYKKFFWVVFHGYFLWRKKLHYVPYFLFGAYFKYFFPWFQTILKDYSIKLAFLTNTAIPEGQFYCFFNRFFWNLFSFFLKYYFSFVSFC